MNILTNSLSLVSNVIKQNAKFILPMAAYSLMQMSEQDVRIEKITQGIFLTLSGASMIAISGIPKKLKSVHKSSSLNLESSSKTALRWGTATAGLLLSSYGIYNIATGIIELTYPSYVQVEQLPVYSSQTQLDSSKFPKSHSQTNSCDVKIARAKKQLLSCPEAEKLWNEVEAEGSFIVRCAKEHEAPFGAQVDLVNRDIAISETEEELVRPMLFELNNLKYAKGGRIIQRMKCEVGVDEYAQAIETFEYMTAKNTYKIADKCVKDGIWPNDLNQYEAEFSGEHPDNWQTIEGYLKSQEIGGHTDSYRIDWYKECDPLRFLQLLILANSMDN